MTVFSNSESLSLQYVIMIFFNYSRKKGLKKKFMKCKSGSCKEIDPDDGSKAHADDSDSDVVSRHKVVSKGKTKSKHTSKKSTLHKKVHPKVRKFIRDSSDESRTAEDEEEEEERNRRSIESESVKVENKPKDKSVAAEKRYIVGDGFGKS